MRLHMLSSRNDCTNTHPNALFGLTFRGFGAQGHMIWGFSAIWSLRVTDLKVALTVAVAELRNTPNELRTANAEGLLLKAPALQVPSQLHFQAASSDPDV